MPVNQILVSDILSFVANLEQCHSNLSADQEAIDKLNDHFNTASRDEVITKDKQELFDFLSGLFMSRYDMVLDDPSHDYTFFQNDTNVLWIELAKKLACVFDTSYIKILFPKIKNTVDLIGLTPLTTTSNTTSFFIGDDNSTLYNKRNLCAFLMENQSLILRSSHGREKILTIKELFRIHSEKSDVIINAQHFNSVWDFLEKIVFPKLNPNQELPHNLLLDFFLLIDQFYKFKRRNAPISQFKEQMDLFCHKLSAGDEEKSNLLRLYGLRINLDEKTYYFIHILIYLYQTNDYDLDNYLTPVLNWLYNFNKKSDRSEISNHAITYLISLFSNINYSGSMRINVGNLSRDVDIEISNIYKKFEPLVNSKEKNIEHVAAIYTQMVNSYTGLSSLFFSPKTDTECPSIKDIFKKTHAQQDVKNYPIELIVHSMLRSRLINSAIHPFLDKLLHISCSDVNEVAKQLQANIILNELLKKVDVETRMEILLYLKEYSYESYENLFLSNCVDYIKNQLLDRVSSLAERNAVESNLDSLLREPLALSELVEAYKRDVASSTQSIGKDTMSQLQQYLAQISSCDLNNYIPEASPSTEPLGIF